MQTKSNIKIKEKKIEIVDEKHIGYLLRKVYRKLKFEWKLGGFDHEITGEAYRIYRMLRRHVDKNKIKEWFMMAEEIRRETRDWVMYRNKIEMAILGMANLIHDDITKETEPVK